MTGMDQKTRSQEIDQIFNKQCQMCLEETKTELLEWYQHNSGLLLHGFIKTVEEGLIKLQIDQADMRKGELRYLQLSYLLSGVSMGADLLKLDFYDKRYYGDPFDFDCFWDYKILFPNTANHREIIRSKLKNEVIRMMDYELEERMAGYKKGQARILKGIIVNMFQEERLRDLFDLDHQHDISVMYGAYMGQSSPICTIIPH